MVSIFCNVDASYYGVAESDIRFQHPRQRQSTRLFRLQSMRHQLRLRRHQSMRLLFGYDDVVDGKFYIAFVRQH